MNRNSKRSSKSAVKKARKPKKSRVLKQKFDLPSGLKVTMDVIREDTGHEEILFCLFPRRGKVICAVTCGGNSIASRTCKNGIVDYVDCISDPPTIVCH